MIIKKTLIFISITIFGLSYSFAQTPMVWGVLDSVFLNFNNSPANIKKIASDKKISPISNILLCDSTGDFQHYGSLENNSIVFLNKKNEKSKIIYDSSALKFFQNTTNEIGFTSTKYIFKSGSLICIMNIENNKGKIYQAILKFIYNEYSIFIEIVDSFNYNDNQILYASDSSYYVIGTINNIIRISEYTYKNQLIGAAQKRIGFSNAQGSILANTVITPSNKKSEFAINFWDSISLDSSKMVINHYRIEKNLHLKLLNAFDASSPHNIYLRPGIYGACFSPNDSFLYYSKNPMLKWRGHASKLFRKNLYDNSNPVEIENSDSLIIYRLALGPDAKIYFGAYKRNNYPNLFLGRINYPDNLDVNGIESDYEYLNHTKSEDISYHKNRYSGFEPNFYIGQTFLKMFCSQKNCTDSIINCFNNSDSTFKVFKWDLMDNDSNLIASNLGNNAKFSPPKTGIYYIRLNGKTKYGRNAYRWNKVYFKKPPRIEHNIVLDTLCRFSDLNKNAHFLSDTINTSYFNWKIISGKNIEIFAGNNLNYNLKDTGFYSIRLVFNDGGCTDSLQFNNSIKVIYAPQASFVISRDTVCTSTEIEISDNSKGNVTETEYLWSDGRSFYIRKGHTRSFKTPGRYKLVQILKASNACISKDSFYLRVKKGLSIDTIPNIIVATVIDSTKTAIKWEGLKGISSYNLTRLNDQTVINITSNNTSYLDSVNAALSPYSYAIIAIDSCLMASGKSNIAKTINLQAKNFNNVHIDLYWNKYEVWESGVAENIVQRSTDGIKWSNVAGFASTSYQDNTIQLSSSDSIFYRIKATQKNNDSIYSESNVVVVSLKSTIFIPNSFTPNSDGLNDVFKIGSFGIKDFSCFIFSNTGQVVGYSTDPTCVWDGISNSGYYYPTDNYYFVMTYTNNKKQKVETCGIINLILD